MATFASAEAGLRVCNKAKIKADVALALHVGQGWQSRGWWSLPSGACQTIIPGTLAAQYYYLYATDGGAGTWSGGKAFCTKRAAPFAIDGRGHCAARGYDSKGFFEIDTGDRKDWTQSLSD